MPKPPPTDLKIVRQIYNMYYADYEKFSRENGSRIEKVLVPIDIKRIARNLRSEEDIVFHRLYHTFNAKYGYKNSDDSLVILFVQEIRKNGKTERHVLRFPLLAAIYAQLREEKSRYNMSIILSIIAIVASLLALFSPYLDRLFSTISLLGS